MSFDSDEGYDDWDDREPDPTGMEIILADENAVNGERVIVVEWAEYEGADHTVGIMGGGWYGQLDDGTDVTFEDGWAVNDKGHRIGKL